MLNKTQKQGLFLVALVMLVAGYGIYFKIKSETISPTSTSVREVPSGGTIGYKTIIFDTHVRKPIYGHSLLPGGADSISDLRFKIQQDPILREWYNSFDWNNAHLWQACGRKIMTYRKQDRIFWTVREINGCQDAVTDGKRLILLRCGNEVSAHPRIPVEASDPGDLETPKFDDTPEFFDVPSDSNEVLATATDTEQIGYGGFGLFGFGATSRPPTQTPEPNLIMVLIVLVVLIVVLR